MNGPGTNPAYRAIGIIALIQAGVVVGGMLFVTVMMKAKGYQQGEVPDWFFNSAAVFVRNCGLVLLILPVTWAALALWLQRKVDSGWMTVAIVLTGIALILAGILNYVELGLNPGIL